LTYASDPSKVNEEYSDEIADALLSISCEGNLVV